MTCSRRGVELKQVREDHSTQVKEWRVNSGERTGQGERALRLLSWSWSSCFTDSKLLAKQMLAYTPKPAFSKIFLLEQKLGRFQNI